MWVADTLQRGPEAVGEGADPSGAPAAGWRPRPEPWGHRTDTAGVTLPSPRGPFSGGCPPLRQCRAAPAFEGFWAQLPSAEAPLPGREHLPPLGQRSCRSPWSPRPTRVGLPAGPPPAGPGTPPFPTSSGGQRGLCSHRLQAARALGGSPSGDASRPAGTCQEVTQPLERFSTNRRCAPNSVCLPRNARRGPCAGQSQRPRGLRSRRDEAVPSPPAVPETTGLRMHYKVGSGLCGANARRQNGRQEPPRAPSGTQIPHRPFPGPWAGGGQSERVSLGPPRPGSVLHGSSLGVPSLSPLASLLSALSSLLSPLLSSFLFLTFP